MPVYKDKKGKFFFKCSIHSRQFVRRGFSSKEEAVKKEHLFIAMFDERKSNFVPTFNELCDSFLIREKENVKITTYLHCQARIREHFIGVFPDIRIDHITYLDFINWRKRLEECHLSEANNFISLLKRIFEFGFVFFGVRVKYASLISPFKDYSYGPSRIKEKNNLLSYDQFKRILSYCDDEKFRLMFITGFITGMRISEVRGLQVKCLVDSKLYVYQQASSKLGVGHSVLISTKSAESNRVYYLPSFLVRALNQYISERKLSPKSFLFYSSCSKDKIIGSTTVSRYLKECGDKAGLQGVHFHMFRHTEASMLNDSGIDRKLIAEYLGHSSEAVTERYYIHDSSEKRIELANILDTKFSELIK